MKEFIKRVAKIQETLKAPKNQRNNFGNYNYRSCEDIMEGLKPILDGLVVTVGDDIKMVGDRIYVVATATITDGENSLTNTAMAREALNKKGMDESQITGTASSYARKYALNGLFMIDDTKDADSMDNSNNQSKSNSKPANKDVQSIREAIKANDLNFVQANWSGMIANQWGNLNAAETETLNKMIGG